MTHADPGIEWDPEKAAANREKHGLTFSAAAGLLRGDEACVELFLDYKDSGHV